MMMPRVPSGEDLGRGLGFSVDGCLCLSLPRSLRLNTDELISTASVTLLCPLYLIFLRQVLGRNPGNTGIAIPQPVCTWHIQDVLPRRLLGYRQVTRWRRSLLQT